MSLKAVSRSDMICLWQLSPDWITESFEGEEWPFCCGTRYRDYKKRKYFVHYGRSEWH